MARNKTAGRRKRNGNGIPSGYRVLGKACHDACYASFLKEIEDILNRDPQARARLDRFILEFRQSVFGKLKF